MLVEKKKGQKRKLYHFSDLINDFSFYEMRELVCNGVKGIAYFIDNTKIDKLTSIESEYENTLILKSKCEYAPEMTKAVLFISK